MTIRTRPATKEYRDNFPFPEKKRKEYKPDMGEAEARRCCTKYVAKKTAEKTAELVSRRGLDEHDLLHGIKKDKKGRIICGHNRHKALLDMKVLTEGFVEPESPMAQAMPTRKKGRKS